MAVNGGLVDPKVRPKGVADGQQVNIPALFYDRLERKLAGLPVLRWRDGA